MKLSDIQRELAELYFDAKAGRRDLDDAVKMARVLGATADVLRDASWEQQIEAIQIELHALRGDEELKQ